MTRKLEYWHWKTSYTEENSSKMERSQTEFFKKINVQGGKGTKEEPS